MISWASQVPGIKAQKLQSQWPGILRKPAIMEHGIPPSRIYVSGTNRQPLPAQQGTGQDAYARSYGPFLPLAPPRRISNPAE
jgi:hypothetical protein